MKGWQRWLRVAIAIFGVGFAALLYVTVRDAQKPAAVPAPDGRTDTEASIETRKGTVSSLGSGGEKWKVDSDRSLTYPDGRQKFTNVRATVPHRNGRVFSLTAKDAEVGPDKQQMVVKGSVELTANDGLVAETAEASFSQNEGVLRAPQRFSFRRKNLSGSSVGMVYDQNTDVMWFLSSAVLKLAPTATDGPLTTIEAGSGSMARRDHYARFEGGFRLVSGTRVLECDTATAFLTDDDAKVTALEMRGNSRISGLGEGAGALRAMQADDANLEFAEDGRTLVGATMAKNASIDMSDAASSGRRIQADWIDVRLAPDGTTVTGLTARDRLLLAMPASRDEPERSIRSATLTAKGEDGKGLTKATFSGDVVYREIRLLPAGRNTRQVTGRSLDLLTEPGFGDIDEAQFAGAVRFNEDQLNAAAGHATYQVKKGDVALDTVDDTTGRVPRVSDGQVTIDAQVIAMVVDQRQITADGEVHSAMMPATAKAQGASGPVHRASMLKQDQPVYATAARLQYDGLKHTAAYTKDARLWQGDTAISGDKIEVDDAGGNLSATGNVRSAMMLEQANAKTKKIDRVSTISVAGTMTYDDAKRRATYKPSAHAMGPQGDLHADIIEMYLKASGSELDRIEAYTKVVMKDPSRWAVGDRMTYFADGERYLMLGKPVRLCADSQETVGAVLRFDKASNTTSIEGSEEFRSKTLNGVQCGEPPK